MNNTMKECSITLGGIDLGHVTEFKPDHTSALALHEYIGAGWEVENCGPSPSRYEISGYYVGDNALYFRQQIEDMRKAEGRFALTNVLSAGVLLIYIWQPGGLLKLSKKIKAQVKIERFSYSIKHWGISWDLTLVEVEELRVPIVQKIETPDITLALAQSALTRILVRIAILKALSLANILANAAGKTNVALSAAVSLAMRIA